MSKYLFVGDHAETLAGGLRVAPGDEVPAAAVDPDNDKRLLDEGKLIDTAAEKAEKKETT